MTTSLRRANAPLILIVVGLAMAAGYEGWMLWEQDRRIVILEENVTRFRSLILRMSHGITADQERVGQSLRDLKQEVASLKADKVKEVGKAGPDQPGSP